MQTTEKEPYRRELKQPLNIIEIPDALLQKQTVVVLAGLSSASIDRKVKAGKFPQPVKDGPRCTRWRAGDVSNWLRSQAQTRVAA
jgi:prophage regulatory protein